jgi:multiple antibiotic resistance protein
MWTLILTTLLALFPIVDPPGTIPLFLSMTEGDDKKERHKQALKGCIYMVVILVSFLLCGGLIMQFFGLSFPGLRIAGGLLIYRFGIRMLYQEPKEITTAELAESKNKQDISFFPLALPYLAGPGAIAATMSLATLATDYTGYVAITTGIFVLGIVTFFILRASEPIAKILGLTGMHALSKVMGFILVAIGVQFVINGCTELIQKFI